MKRIIATVLLLSLALILAGCNMAPNVPGVTPYGNTVNDNDGVFDNDRFNGNNARNNVGNNVGNNAADNAGDLYAKRNNNERLNTDNALNTRELFGDRRTVNATDKALLPGG
jgi:hypothetical protein